jgi:microcystin-dependent protein
MSSPLLSEIRAVSFNFPPKGWAFCNGQLLPINQNQALFSLLGTTYGGDGRVNFGLPDLQGRIPMHEVGGGNNHTLGERGGEQTHTLSVSELPGHSHPANCSDVAGAKPDAKGGVWARDNNGNAPYSSSGDATMATTAPGAIGVTGGSQSHPNLAPFTVLNFCIALQGIFPSQN